jgi:hypothetical protein
MVAFVLFGGLVGAAEVGFRLGVNRGRKADRIDHLGAIQGAVLGLLALLLGFSFSAASDRFSARIDMMVEESNAIRDVWLNIELMPEAQQPALRQMLRHYVDLRVAFYEVGEAHALEAVLGETVALQSTIWTAGINASKAAPTFAAVWLPPIAKVFDLYGKRLAASRRNLPVLILLLLLACSGVAVGAVSYGCGIAHQRSTVLSTALAFLVAAVLWAIIDMDHPKRGLIRAGQEPILKLRSSLEKADAAVPPPQVLRR